LAVEVNEESKWLKISEQWRTTRWICPCFETAFGADVGRKLFIKGCWLEECRPCDRDVLFECLVLSLVKPGSFSQ